MTALRAAATRVVAARRGSPEMYAAIRDLGITLGLKAPPTPRAVEPWEKIGRRTAVAANRYAAPLRIVMPDNDMAQVGRLHVPPDQRAAIVGRLMRGSSKAWRAYCAGDREALVAARDLYKLGRRLARPLAAAKRAAKVNRHPFAEAALTMRVDDLELSTRSANALMYSGASTVGDLIRFDEHTLLGLKNFGRKSLDEIKESLGSLGLSLAAKMEDPPAWARR